MAFTCSLTLDGMKRLGKGKRRCEPGVPHTFLFWKVVFALAIGELGGFTACEQVCKRSLQSAASQVVAFASIRFCISTQSHKQEGCHFYDRSTLMSEE